MLLCSLCLLMLPRLSALLLLYTQACMLLQSNKMLNEVESPNIHTAGSQGWTDFRKWPTRLTPQAAAELSWIKWTISLTQWGISHEGLILFTAIFFRGTQGFAVLCHNWILVPEKLWEGCAHRSCLLGRQSGERWKGTWYQTEAVLLTCPRVKFF